MLTPSPPARPGLHICPYPPRGQKARNSLGAPSLSPARPSAPSPAPACESRRPHKLTSTHTRKQGEEEGEKRPSKWASEMTVLNGPPSALAQAQPCSREYPPAQADSRTYAQARHGEEKINRFGWPTPQLSPAPSRLAQPARAGACSKRQAHTLASISENQG